jgi:hypothetical protein
MIKTNRIRLAKNIGRQTEKQQSSCVVSATTRTKDEMSQQQQQQLRLKFIDTAVAPDVEAPIYKNNGTRNCGSVQVHDVCALIVMWCLKYQ